ncbi:S-layer homology domain-containing protein [Cytobacillus spongiae]|uniref:S-layer homology domain-containing protein n=1 Tax=Cytobacillus spongiae TaxID=2901381 RepID=UPI001F1FFD97|nr:S-layer homology domain-containing protein [Cytobacillus spongiae]UII55642.1 S-layer homology domain-containing protein [Cytobacillus spongiae]
MRKTVMVIFLMITLPLSYMHSQVKAEELSDVRDHWAKNQISTLVNKNVISGFENGTFQPNAPVTRGQFIAFLVRGLRLPPGETGFKDVTRGSSLYDEMAAGKRAGLIVGTKEGYSKANAPVTRADVAVMIDRALQLRGDYTELDQLDFDDQGTIPAYALQSIQRTVKYGIVLGTKENKINHKSTATRAESAVFVYRMLEVLNELEGLPTSPPPSNNGEPGASKNISSSEVAIPIGDGNQVKIRMNTSGVPLHYKKSDEFTHIHSKDFNYYYDMGYKQNPLGFLRVTLRKLDNGDTFIFSRFIHNGDNTYSASIILPFEQASSYSLKRIDSYGQVKREHDDTIGIDPTSHPIGLLSVKSGQETAHQVMMSKNYTSIQREKPYANGQKSVVREFLDEFEGYKIYSSSSAVSMQLDMKVTGKAISESWALLSNEPLFQDSYYMDYWFQRSVDEYHTINKWLTADGVYTKLPWSIEPGYKLGFGRNLGYMQGGIYLRAYNGSSERYFYDLVMNSIADLDVFTNGAIRSGDVPVFKTEYTSTWLKNAYGTTAPYIDTRHNENTALFLKNAGETFQIPQLAKANQKYADFLVDQKAIGNVIKITSSSHLIADYYAPGSKTTHVSLNHALGEMRFLIETYLQTNDAKYLKTAKEIKAAVEHLYPRWIRDDGDLWYQVNGNLVFNGRDYEWLTLVDLLASQELFEDIGMVSSSIFDSMIRSKTEYLIHTNQYIKSSILEMLSEQGYTDLVEKYKNNVTSSSNILEEPKELVGEHDIYEVDGAVDTLEELSK